MKKIFLAVLLVLLVLLAIFGFSWFKLHQELSLRNLANPKTPADYGLQYQTRDFKASDGTGLQGWYMPVANPKAVVIQVHGYRDTKATVLDQTGYLHDAGYATFAIDLRSDKPNTKVTLGVEEWKDVAAAYDYMKSLPENSNLHIGFYGGSMGASVSIVAAGKTGKGDFIIASVPYANFKSLFEQRAKLDNLPTIIVPFVLLASYVELGQAYDTYTPDKWIGTIHKPIFLISAAKDIKVNSEDAKELYALANDPKFYWQAYANHDAFKEEPAEYKQEILEFLQTLAK
jgi:dipeptidyl aminopeptidase/acylaminoacyl peptidase